MTACWPSARVDRTDNCFVRPLTAEDADRLFTEGAVASALYGATSAPNSQAEMDALFAAMAPKLERSDIVFEFLDIMRAAPLLPASPQTQEPEARRAAATRKPALHVGTDATSLAARAAQDPGRGR